MVSAPPAPSIRSLPEVPVRVSAPAVPVIVLVSGSTRQQRITAQAYTAAADTLRSNRSSSSPSHRRRRYPPSFRPWRGWQSCTSRCSCRRGWLLGPPRRHRRNTSSVYGVHSTANVCSSGGKIGGICPISLISRACGSEAPMGLVRIPTERFEHVEFRVEAMRVDRQHPESRPCAGRAWTAWPSSGNSRRSGRSYSRSRSCPTKTGGRRHRRRRSPESAGR